MKNVKKNPKVYRKTLLKDYSPVKVCKNFFSETKIMIYENRHNKHFESIIVNNFLSINFRICFGCSKKRLIETVLLSTHNICFG